MSSERRMALALVVLLACSALVALQAIALLDLP